jgi:MFS family permease
LVLDAALSSSATLESRNSCQTSTGNQYLSLFSSNSPVAYKFSGIGLGFTEFCIVIPWAGLAVLLGNELNAHASWRWIFYLAVIYSAICLAGTTAFYFPPSRPQGDYEKSRWQEVKDIDYIGIILYAGGLTTFLIGLTWAGSDGHPWKSASVIALIVVGVVIFIGSFVYDFTVPKQPFFPFRLFRKFREFTVLLSFVFVSGMSFYAISALLPRGSLYMFTHDPTQIGIISIPGGLGQVLGGFIIPSLVHRIKHIKIQIVSALVIQTIFIACYSTVVLSNRSGWMALQFFAQSCFPLITVLCYVTAGLHVRQRDLGIASGLIGTFRSAGGSVGNAVFNTILNGVVNDQLGPRVSKAALSLGYPAADLKTLIPAVIKSGSGVHGAFTNVSGVSPEIEAATAQAFKEAYAYAFRRVFWSTVPFGVLAIIAACFLIDPSEYLTNHVAVHMEKEVIGGGRTENIDEIVPPASKAAMADEDVSSDEKN